MLASSRSFATSRPAPVHARTDAPVKPASARVWSTAAAVIRSNDVARREPDDAERERHEGDRDDEAARRQSEVARARDLIRGRGLDDLECIRVLLGHMSQSTQCKARVRCT
jgi:hypothetical protein